MWHDEPPFTVNQLKAARGAMSWGLRQTAKAGKTTTQSLCKFENGATVHRSVLEPVRDALECEGIVFTEGTENNAPGIAFRMQ
ncbi:MAG: hypothetical protein KZQ96_22330 [Candidatus Thiodiazotropha sp. (ex Lucinoma borealis)]|nr:hypothetical protein [Candidatus Thiodiazotropha sp. (ex Lucinoma borealis)]MCU7868246.1 hypothetical protein [Candidatus Thiodiazotropha sp. (ex Lucinoma borealis)]